MSRLLSSLLVTLLCLCLGGFSVAQEVASAESLNIEGAKVSPLSSEKDIWGDVPDFVEGATLLRPSTGNILQFTAKKEVQVLVVASWFIDGDSSGTWYPSRTSPAQLYKQGWQVVGLMKKKKAQEHNYVLRKTLKAGEEVKFHTRKVNPPFILIPAAEKLAALAKTPVFMTAVHALSLFKPSAPGPAEGAGKVVLLRTTEPDIREPFEVQGTLLRELVRQAVLLAARDELGLSTRDETLHEYWGTGPADAPLPLDIIVSATQDHRVKVTLCRFPTTVPQILFDEELQLPLEEDLILALAAKGELLSRKELVTALRKAGFDGKANASADRKPVPENINAAILHLVPQFAAARQLHQLIKEDGESPERLVALARIYAHLGMLSEHFWYQGHKAFQARALLYAQRATVRWPESATARYGRGYVRALIGLHQAALDDLAAARKLKGGRPPEWTETIESYCRFDLARLDELAAENIGLPRLLRLLAHDGLSDAKTILNAVELIRKDVTDCDRAMGIAYKINDDYIRHWSSRASIHQTSEMWLPHAGKVPGLPPAAGKICQEELASRPQPEEQADLAEALRRGAFIAALRDQATTEPDRQEPSWQVLATLTEEISFMETARFIFFVRGGILNQNPERIRNELAPMAAKHPLWILLECFSSDPLLRLKYARQAISELRLQDFSSNQRDMLFWLERFGVEGEIHLATVMTAHQDATYRDLATSVEAVEDISFRKACCGELRRVSPHSPLSMALSIEHDWEFAAPRAGEWERQFSQSHRVQLALGKGYLHAKKYADGIRCLEQAAAIQWESEVFGLIAKAWLEQKDEKQWQATWDKYLAGEDTPMSKAQVQESVANHLMLQGRYEEALPYAEATGRFNASWGLTCLADCLTGLKRYEEAEENWKSNAEQYQPNGNFKSYFWRQRTGRGDLEKARQEITTYLAAQENRVAAEYRIPFLILVGEKEQSLKIYREYLVQNPSPHFGWGAALLFDELGDAKNRDISWKLVLESAHKPRYKAPFLAELAKLCQGALQDPARLEALPKQIDALVAGIELDVDSDDFRTLAAYLGGKFLLLHGKEAAGEALLKRVTQSPFTTAESALAAKELRDLKMKQEAKGGEGQGRQK